MTALHYNGSESDVQFEGACVWFYSLCYTWLESHTLSRPLDIFNTDELLYPVVFKLSRASRFVRKLLDFVLRKQDDFVQKKLRRQNYLCLVKRRRLFEISVCVYIQYIYIYIYSVTLVSLRSALILTCMNIRACPFSHGSMSVILWAFLNCKWCILQKWRNHTMWWLLFSKVCNIVSEKRVCWIHRLFWISASGSLSCISLPVWQQWVNINDVNINM